MSKRRKKKAQARAARRAEEEVRDLVVVAAAIEGFEHAHPGLLAEPVPSDHPLVTEPLHPHVLTHDASSDESGDGDE